MSGFIQPTSLAQAVTFKHVFVRFTGCKVDEGADCTQASLPINRHFRRVSV